ncbi:Protein phosphatase 2C [Legionella steigerwaltii]|uniref:Protein phosphatase 2C n=1 Tax=Legionella steigerwaltii TaxID=460 RepID=A0A378LJB0_9GAMM|nr:PP2C family protein-serine/threonine phosphatase [Legionella steigerwaltii]KTD78738.1 Protein phosphatase 2C [Legionella steigerwaltii]STY24171.1 Protein phosphatase 2C [Legionella steigerwaltii]
MTRIHQITSLPHDKEIVCEHVKEHSFGLYETMGARPSQEDAAFACWYTPDHFHLLTPQEIGRRLWTSYHLVNRSGQHVIYGGTTASTTVYDGQGTLITATLADSVSFAVVYDKHEKLIGVLRLNSIIHHPNVELERIKRAGGFVLFDRINGQLAVSRAIGDFDFNDKVVCADASIDINPLDKIYEHLDISSEKVGKVQIISTCDGFTEPLISQTQKEHEQWLFNCLSKIPSASKQQEQQLAKTLVNEALEWGSRDNISIAIQTLSPSLPFLIGIYDGHGGKGASHYTAEHIGAIFDSQCALTQEAYAQQSLSADKNFIIYYRDNKDQKWYEPLAEAEKKNRELKCFGTSTIHSPLNLLRAETEVYLTKTNKKDAEILSTAVQGFCHFLDALCSHYVDLSLNEREFVECLSYLLKNDAMYRGIDARYSFLSLDFKACREYVDIIKKYDSLRQILMRLVLSG